MGPLVTRIKAMTKNNEGGIIKDNTRKLADECQVGAPSLMLTVFDFEPKRFIFWLLQRFCVRVLLSLGPPSLLQQPDLPPFLHLSAGSPSFQSGSWLVSRALPDFGQADSWPLAWSFPSPIPSPSLPLSFFLSLSPFVLYHPPCWLADAGNISGIFN